MFKLTQWTSKASTATFQTFLWAVWCDSPHVHSSLSPDNVTQVRWTALSGPAFPQRYDLLKSKPTSLKLRYLNICRWQSLLKSKAGGTTARHKPAACQERLSSHCALTGVNPFSCASNKHQAAYCGSSLTDPFYVPSWAGGQLLWWWALNACNRFCKASHTNVLVTSS